MSEWLNNPESYIDIELFALLCNFGHSLTAYNFALIMISEETHDVGKLKQSADCLKSDMQTRAFFIGQKLNLN